MSTPQRSTDERAFNEAHGGTGVGPSSGHSPEVQRGFRGQLYNGFGEGLAQAFEFAVTPLLFGGIGYLLDGWLGIRPVLTIVLTVFALVGMFVRMWYGYDREMRAHEARGAWSKR